MKKIAGLLSIVVLFNMLSMHDSKAQHSAGLVLGAGPSFRTGYSHVVTFGAEYKYLLLKNHLGVGVKVGLVNVGLNQTISLLTQALGGSSEKGVTAFLGVASFDYFILTNKWKPYVSVDFGGMASDKSKNLPMYGVVASPGIGTRFAVTDKIDLEAAFRFPIFVNFASTNDKTLASMTVGLGAHYNFGAK